MEQAGAAVVIGDAELTAQHLARTVGELVADPGRLAQMATASRRLARPNAAADIAAEVLEAATR